jgi:purine-binding chemotaxis protein CheW
MTVAEDIMEIDEDTQKDKYLTFFIKGEIYGIDIRLVTEIIGIQPITEVPEVPVYVKGIINLRGRIIPVMDMRLRFKKEFLPYTDRTCVIVIEAHDMSLGLIVDGVAEVLSIPEAEIVPPPEFKATQNKYIRGIGKTGTGVTLLLDCDKLLNEKEENVLMNL